MLIVAFTPITASQGMFLGVIDAGEISRCMPYASSDCMAHEVQSFAPVLDDVEP